MSRDMFNIKTLMTTALIGAALFAGCGKEENQVIQPAGNVTGGTGFTNTTGLGNSTGTGSTGTSNTGTTTTTTTGTYPLPPPYPDGENQELVPVSASVFSQFATARPWLGRPNAPGPINANLDFGPYGGTPKVFLGFFTLQYYDRPYGSQQTMQGYMDNGYPKWSVKNGNYIHQLYIIDGKPVVRIMVEDRFGAVTLILRPGVGGSDSDVGKWTAKVYFFNFPKPTAPNPRYDPICGPGIYGGCIPANSENYCWGNLIKDGPYRCKNFDIPPSSSGKYPFNLLGTIKNIDLKLALGL